MHFWKNTQISSTMASSQSSDNSASSLLSAPVRVPATVNNSITDSSSVVSTDITSSNVLSSPSPPAVPSASSSTIVGDGAPTPEVIKEPGVDASSITPEARALLEQITCTKCLQPFKDARMLPCLHSFCAECVKDIAGEFKAPKCPLCLTEFSASLISSLPPTFWAPIIADAYQKATHPVIRMDACKKVARSRCITCDDFLCEDCVDLHKSHPRFVHHKTLTLEEFDAPRPASERQVLCILHPEKVCWFVDHGNTSTM